jgi:hypothetical protein
MSLWGMSNCYYNGSSAANICRYDHLILYGVVGVYRGLGNQLLRIIRKPKNKSVVTRKTKLSITITLEERRLSLMVPCGYGAEVDTESIRGSRQYGWIPEDNLTLVSCHEQDGQ